MSQALIDELLKINPLEVARMKQVLRIDKLPSHHEELKKSYTFDRLSRPYQINQIAEAREWLESLIAHLYTQESPKPEDHTIKNKPIGM